MRYPGRGLSSPGTMIDERSFARPIIIRRERERDYRLIDVKIDFAKNHMNYETIHAARYYSYRINLTFYFYISKILQVPRA